MGEGSIFFKGFVYGTSRHSPSNELNLGQKLAQVNAKLEKSIYCYLGGSMNFKSVLFQLLGLIHFLFSHHIDIS